MTDIKRHDLTVVPEDSKRAGKVKDDTPLREVGEHYVACNGKFLLRLSHEAVSAKAWNLLEGDWQASNWGLKGKLESIMPLWLPVICPQAGGLLEQVEVEEATGFMMSKRARRIIFTHNDLAYSFPASQYELMKAFYPEVLCYVGPTLYGYDLFGERVTITSPVVCRVKGLGPVGVIMPLGTRADQE